MAEQTKPRAKKPRAASKPAVTPVPAASSKGPIIEEQTLKAILAWMNIIDDWSVAGYQNKFPRWVYVLLAFLILT